MEEEDEETFMSRPVRIVRFKGEKLDSRGSLLHVAINVS